jgi:hypothetical protein
VQNRMLEGFLRSQHQEGMHLAAESDLLDLLPVGAEPHTRFIAEFGCKGLVRDENGGITEANRFAVGIWFPPDYLRRADPFQVLAWLGPKAVFHPNISHMVPLICVGRLTPGTPLVDLLYQVFEIITYQKVTMREDDALNPAACSWARQNAHRFPIDPRPLKRRVVQFQLSVAGPDGQTPEGRSQ